MAIPPNIWQDNFLTGSTPFVVYPRAVANSGLPIPYGFTSRRTQLPKAYTPSGQNVFASGNPKRFRRTPSWTWTAMRRTWPQ